jgi:hypothetical protein
MTKEWKDKRVKVEVFLHPDEFQILKELAEKEKSTLGEYMRQAFMADAVIDLNTKAIKLTASRAKEMLLSRLKRSWVHQVLENVKMGKLRVS